MTAKAKFAVIAVSSVIGLYVIYSLTNATANSIQNSESGAGDAVGKVLYFAGILGVSILALALAPVGL